MHPENKDIHDLLSAIGRAQPPADLQQRILTACLDADPVRALDCDEALELASAYLDGELHGASRDAFEAHVFACESCYAAFKQMERTTEVLRETPPAAVPAGLCERITAAVERDSREHERVPVHSFNWRRMTRVLGGLAAAAALLAAVFMPRGDEAVAPSAPVIAEAPAEVAGDTADEAEPLTEAAEPIAEEVAETPDVEEPTSRETRVAAAPEPARESARAPAATERTPAPPRVPPEPEPARAAPPTPRPEPTREETVREPASQPRPERPAREEPSRETPPPARERPQPDPEPVIAAEIPAPAPARAPEIAPEPPVREPRPRETVVAATPRPDPEPAPASTAPPSPESAANAHPPRPGRERDTERLAVVPQQPHSRTVYKPDAASHSERAELTRMTEGINGSQNPRMDNPSRGIILN